MVVTGRTGRSPLSELRGAVMLLGIAKMILYPAMLIQVANASLAKFWGDRPNDGGEPLKSIFVWSVWDSIQ